MNSESLLLLKNLNERLLMQSVVIETLCDILIDSGMITDDELDKLIHENVKSQEDEIKKITKEALGGTSLLIDTDVNESNEDILNGMYFGPVGEA